MSKISNVLIVHTGENVDNLKGELELQFPMLENILTCHIDCVRDLVKTVPYQFHCIIAVPSVKQDEIPEFPYTTEILYHASV